MQPIEIKRGATFKVDLQFEDAEEWALVFPNDGVVAAVKFGHRRYPVPVTVDQVNFRFTAKVADTSSWPLTGDAYASFDYGVTRNGEKIPYPGSYNVPLKVIEGPSFQ